MPWTLDSLERSLRIALMERTRLRIKELPVSRSAEVEWVEPHGRARVNVDSHEVTIRAGTLHELLHVVLGQDLEKFDETLTEAIILAFEQEIDQRISRSPRRKSWWRKAIASKLPK